MTDMPHNNASRVRRMLEGGLNRFAADLPRQSSNHISRLSLRLPRDAGPDDVARAMEKAIGARTGHPAGHHPGRGET